MNDGGG